jgi:hypothetical protein
MGRASKSFGGKIDPLIGRRLRESTIGVGRVYTYIPDSIETIHLQPRALGPAVRHSHHKRCHQYLTVLLGGAFSASSNFPTIL